MADLSTARPSDPATALFERKLKLAEGLSCRQLLADWDALDAQLDAANRERAECDERVRAAHAQLAEAESLAALTVEGKNETERKARKLQALRDDPTYREAAAAVGDAERRRTEAEADAEALRRQARRVEKAIDYRIAALRLLGG